MKKDYDYIGAINNVLWYNGLWEIVKEWKNAPRNKYGDVLAPEHYGAEEGWSENQLQVIWMIAVDLFGNYGTSPRFGWIEAENYEAFCEWIDKLCEGHEELNCK